MFAVLPKQKAQAMLNGVADKIYQLFKFGNVGYFYLGYFVIVHFLLN